MSTGDRKLKVAFQALKSILERLSLSLDEDATFFPVTAASVKTRKNDEAKTRDAFLQRFQQAADHLLRKLFPRLQAAISGNLDILPIGELLQELDRAGLIEDAGTWKQILELRNRLTHDYALDAEESAESLNEAWRRAPYLIRHYHSALAYAERHSLIDKAAR